MKSDKTETLRDKRKAMWEKMNKPENKTEALRARLQREEEQLLSQIDEAAWVIESMSAGKIYLSLIHILKSSCTKFSAPFLLNAFPSRLKV